MTYQRLERISLSDRRAKGNLEDARMSRSRNKSRGVYKVVPLARMHKIFTRATPRTPVRVLLRRFMRRVSQIGEDAAALCYQRVSPPVPRQDETFSPRAICRRQCALPRDFACRASRPVCLFSLIALSFLTLNSRLPHYPVPLSPLAPRSLRSLSPSLISSVTLAWCFLRSSFLSCNHIPAGNIAGNIALPLLGNAFVNTGKIQHLEGKSVEKVNVITRSLSL